jgi:hypothetical protein
LIDWDTLVIGPCTAVFGETVLYQPLGGVAYAVAGIFDEAYQEQFPIEGLTPGNVSNTRPMLGVQLSQFPAGQPPMQDDVLTIVRTGQAYWVNEVRVDSHGAARLLLNVAPR